MEKKQHMDALQYFQCNKCGSVMDIEEEVTCWDCGKGEMIYKHDEAKDVPCRHMLWSLIHLRASVRAKVIEQMEIDRQYYTRIIEEKNGWVSSARHPLPRPRNDMQEKNGLYEKYRVYKRGEDGVDRAVDDCFVLRWKDAHARKALRAYANSVRATNVALAADLFRTLNVWETEEDD